MENKQLTEKVLEYIEYLLGSDEDCGNFFSTWSAEDVSRIIHDSCKEGERFGFSHRTIALGVVCGAMVAAKKKAN